MTHQGGDGGHEPGASAAQRGAIAERWSARPVVVPAVFESIVQQSPDVVVLLDAAGTVTFVNDAVERVLGYDPAGVHAAGIESIPGADRQLLHELAGGEAGVARRFDLRLVHGDGTWRTLDAAAQVLAGDAAGSLLLQLRDVTEQRDAEKRRDHERLHDPLTGLLTTAAFVERVHEAIAATARGDGAAAVFTLDVDAFRDVNARFGFDGGDEALRTVAQRIECALRTDPSMAEHSWSVSRSGGDVFLVLCAGLSGAATAATLAQRLLGAVSAEPVAVLGQPVSLTATVGVALADPGDRRAGSLLLDAGAAVLVGKARGGGCVEFHSRSLSQGDRVRRSQVAELRVAIEQGQLGLLYQPKVDIGSGQLVGVEALVRWEHPQRGMVPPVEFIPLAEDAGLIDALGTWVLHEACRQRGEWSSLLGPRSQFVVCVNVSRRQFKPTFPGLAARALSTSGIPRGSLCIEITESAVMRDVDGAVETLQELRSLGVAVSIDDFGTGFSSLAQLKRLPLDELKIDRSFVDGLGRGREDTAIVAALVAMAQALDMWVVAEGVETVDQLDQLRTLGCELAQGYLFSRPVPAARITEILAGRERLLAGGGAVPSPERPHTETVLVVDDSLAVRQLAKVSLAASGFEVVEAEDGHQALERARRDQPVCVVLDVSMPGLSGLDVCRALRADPETASLTIVMLTGHATARDKVEAFAAGADDYMVKPFSPREIVGRVRTAVNRRRA